MSTVSPTVLARSASPARATPAPVVRRLPRRREVGVVGWAAVVVAVVLAASPVADGYFDFDWWGAVALGALVLLVVLAGVVRPSFTRYGVFAFGGVLLLLGLSAVSMLWAESRDSAWTEVNRLSLYAAVFAVGLVAVRDRRTARVVLVVLGSAALLASLWLCLSFLFGANQGAFLTRRLNSPIGYINGTACLLVMGVWPWIALAESAWGRLARAGALSAAAVIAGMLVLTQSRAVMPAILLSAVLVVACAGGRTRRAVNLLLVTAAVGVALPWTLAVYSTGGAADRLLLPSHGLVRAAAAAILLCAVGVGVARLVLGALADRVEAARREEWLRRLGVTLAVVSVCLVVVLGVVGGPYIARQWQNFTALRVNESAATRFTDFSGYRYDLWRVALREFEQHPVGGLGAGNYDDEYYQLRRTSQYVIVPHSLELQMAAELGVGGVVALLLFCGAVLAACFARRGTLASTDRLVKVAGAGMFAAWLIDTSVDWTYDIPGLAGAAILAAALLVVPARSERVGAPRRSRRAQACAAVALAVLALLAASVGRQYAATRYQEAGATELAASPRAALSTLAEAEKLDPYSLETLYSLASAYARENNYPRARDTLLQAQALEPENYVTPALLGDLATRRGDSALAAAEYRRALVLDPNDPELRDTGSSQ